MRLLVSCRSCRRQYDAGGLAEGSRFRCRCGAIARVPSLASRDAAVVRCSSCGAPRRTATSSCGFCGADFTLIEQNLGTICPSCAARVSDRARFCHGCGTALTAEEVAGSTTDKACPACGSGRALHSRKLDEEDLSVLECPHCAGLWLGEATLEVLLDRSRQRAGSSGNDHHVPPSVRGAPPTELVVYRPCPECGKRMNPRNWGRTSGVIVDGCKGHGIWFDHDELEGVLQWVRNGGEPRVQQEKAREGREAERRKRFDPIFVRGTLEEVDHHASDGSILDALTKLAGWLAR